VGAPTKLDGDLFPAFVVDVCEDFIERDADGDDADRVGVLFLKDFADTTDCFGDLEGYILAVDLDVLADVLATDILDGFQFGIFARGLQ